jgi:hypothetical protein
MRIDGTRLWTNENARPLARFFSQNYGRIDRLPLPRIMMRNCADLFFMRHSFATPGARRFDGHAWMFHEDTADRRKDDVITTGPQFCALRISAFDRSDRRAHTEQVGQRDETDRLDSSRHALVKTERCLQRRCENIHACWIFMCNWIRTYKRRFLSSFTPPFPSLSLSPSFYAAIYTAISGRRWKREEETRYT